MKKIKLLFTLPIVTTALVPLVSCNNPLKIKMTMTSDKVIETNLSIVCYCFNINQFVDKTQISFEIYNETSPAGGMITPSITLDGNDLYLYIGFEEYTSSKYTFDVKFNIRGTEVVFEGLSATLIPATTVLPEAALIINDGVLEGLNPNFTILSIYNTLQIPDSVTSIKADAFKNAFTKTSNSNITTLVLNNNLQTIGANAFDGCNAIKTLDVSNVDVSETQCPITIETNAFDNWAISGTINYKTGDHYNLLDYQLCDQGLARTWFNSAVPYRPTLESDFYMPDQNTVSGFAWDATNGTMPRHMTELVDVLSIPKRCTEITNNAFYNSDSSTTSIPSNVKLLYLPDNLQKIGDYAFAKAPFISSSTSLGYFELPISLSHIGKYAFSGSNILHIKFLSGLQTLDEGAFYQCASLYWIDVSSLSLVPAGWSMNKTFDEICEAGKINVRPSCAFAWEEYFDKFEIDLSQWVFSKQIDLLAPTIYVPSFVPMPGASITKAQAVSQLMSVYHNQHSIAIDDIIYTFFDGNRAGYTKLIVYFNSIDIDANGCLTASISYEAKTFDPDSKLYKGSWIFYNIPLNTFDSVESNPTSKVMTFKFMNLFDTQPAFIYISETIDGGVERTATINSNDTLTTENLGKVLSGLGLFDTDNHLLKIDSRYFGNSTISD